MTKQQAFIAIRDIGTLVRLAERAPEDWKASKSGASLDKQVVIERERAEALRAAISVIRKATR